MRSNSPTAAAGALARERQKLADLLEVAGVPLEVVRNPAVEEGLLSDRRGVFVHERVIENGLDLAPEPHVLYEHGLLERAEQAPGQLPAREARLGVGPGHLDMDLDPDLSQLGQY